MVIYHIKEVPDMAQRTRSTPLVPSEENPVIGRATVKAFILDQTPNDEKFLYAVELESPFWALGKDGKPMRLTKRKGKGHLGGRVEESEEEYLEHLRRSSALKKHGVNIDKILTNIKGECDYFLALIREIEEESGIPPEHFVTKINHQITWKRSSDTDNHEWILYLVDGQGLQEHVNRAAIKDPKLIKLLRTNKVGWARFRDFGLQKTIFAPGSREERKTQEEAGDVWFYTGHTVGLSAMLLMIGRREPLLCALTLRDPVYSELLQDELEEQGLMPTLYNRSSRAAGLIEVIEPVESSLLGETPDPEDEDPFFADLKERALRGF